MTSDGRPAPALAAQPAVVMLHGFALDARMWRRQVEALAPDHRVLTVDLPGFGPQARELGETDPAGGVARAMDAAKIDAAHLVGNSFGAAVAIDFALRFPDRVSSLVLVGPLLLGRRTNIAAWPRCVSLAAEGDKTTAAEVWLDDPLFETARHDDELFDELRQIVLDYGGGHWTGRVSSHWSEHDPAASLRRIDAPALVVSGEADLPSFLQMAEAYAKTLPHAKRQILPGAGHLANMERADEFNAVLRSFFATR